MNKTSTDKIKSATRFLIWFRRCLPPGIQAQIRPYLDRPYQLTLAVLDRCDPTEPLSVKDIAQAAGVSHHTVKQVLLALKDGGMTFAVSPTPNWQLSQAESLLDPAFDSSRLETAQRVPSSQ